METHVEFVTDGIVAPAAGNTKETGAEVEFKGIVREMEQGRAITALDYEAHVPMAERQVRRILDQLNESWPCQEVWFIHRLGRVPVGETLLYVRVRAPHRQAAFHFCMELIDLLKKDVPIWKAARVE